jgi:signal transduction histidine kinase/CheY-like chemotaxis protein
MSADIYFQYFKRAFPAFALLPKERLFAVLVLCSGFIASLFISLATPFPAVRVFSLVLFSFWLLLLWFFWRGLSLSLACQLASALGAVQLFVIAWFSGGVYASCLVWFAVLIVANYFIVGRVAAFFWFLIDILCHCVQAYAFDWWGWGPVLGLDNQNALASLIDYSFSFAIIIAILVFYHSQYEHAVNDLERTQQDLRNTEKELTQTLQIRESFIGSVSHELRTPMNAIMGFNSLLLSMVRDKPRALMVLDHTRQSADHLLTVINDILDYTQFKSGQLRARIEPADLYQTIGSAFGLFMPRIESSVCYSCDLPPNLPTWVETDSHRLTQVLVNLLGNAIKFTSEGDVKLTVTCLPNDWVEFKVSDTGIGIAEDEQTRLFSSFTQANPSIQARFGGSGLGLMISQRLVHLLGGDLGFKSELGKGSEFWFKLRLPAVDPPTPPSPVEPDVLSQGFSKLRFLIVDDHAVNRLVLRQILLNQWPDAVVEEAGDGFAALSYLKEHAFDLVFLDMVMPGLGGIETAERLADPDFRTKPPLIGLTANVNPHDLDAFYKAGLSGLLLKPFNREQLIALINQLLSNRISHS